MATGLTLIGSASAVAQSGSEEGTGAGLLRSVQQGQKSCDDLSDTDFELMGEAWMRQMFGSSQAHEAMNQLMGSMMGFSGEHRMHEYMGRRASGCGGGSLPSGFGRMMNGVRGMMAMLGGGGMMGGAGGNYGAGMMGGYSQTSGSATGDNDDDGPSAAAMVGMMAVLIGAVAVALVIFRPWRHQAGNARDLLDRRLAGGEISTEEYRRAKSLLEGGAR